MSRRTSIPLVASPAGSDPNLTSLKIVPVVLAAFKVQSSSPRSRSDYTSLGTPEHELANQFESAIENPKSPIGSLIAQRYHRIHLGRPTRREISGHEGDGDEQQRDRGKSSHIRGAHIEKQAREKAGQRK